MLYRGKAGTAGTLDAAFLKAGSPPSLFIAEAKGGGSGLGTRVIDGIVYQQGSPEYLRWMLANDRAFREAASKAGVLRAIEDGTLKVEYHLVTAPGGTKVSVAEFILDATRLRGPR